MKQRWFVSRWRWTASASTGIADNVGRARSSCVADSVLDTTGVDYRIGVAIFRLTTWGSRASRSAHAFDKARVIARIARTSHVEPAASVSRLHRVGG